MNDSLISFRGIAFALLAMLIVALLAGPVFAAAPYGAASDAATPIVNSQFSVYQTAGFFTEVAGNRAKIIQMSIVFVLIGIALLFKK